MAPGIRRVGLSPVIVGMKVFFKMSALLMAAGLLAATSVLAGESHDDETEQTASHDMTKIIQMMEAFGLTPASGPQLIMPMMSSARGRKLFASKGCVTCHSINGVGGEDAPNLDAHSMLPLMNPFEFAARMWRGAATMIYLQEEALGEQIMFTGAELADIIAFVHDEEEQHKFSEDDIPPEIMPMMSHMHEEEGGGAAVHAHELGHTGDDDGHTDDEGDEHHDE